MDAYTLKKLAEAEQAVADMRQPSATKHNNGDAGDDADAVIVKHQIPVLGDGSYYLAVSGMKIEKAALIMGGKVISYSFPEYRDGEPLPERMMLDFFGPNKRLHKNMCKVEVAVEFHFAYNAEDTSKCPSLVLGEGYVLPFSGEHAEDVVVRDANGNKINCTMVYRGSECGLRIGSQQV